MNPLPRKPALQVTLFLGLLLILLLELLLFADVSWSQRGALNTQSAIENLAAPSHSTSPLAREFEAPFPTPPLVANASVHLPSPLQWPPAAQCSSAPLWRKTRSPTSPSGCL